MGSEIKYTNIGKLKQTRLHSVNTQLSVADGIAVMKERLSTLTWRLHNVLSSEAFDDEAKEVIKNCRVIRDLKPLLVKIYEKGSALVGLKETKSSLNAVRSITESVATVYDGDLMNHCRIIAAQ